MDFLKDRESAFLRKSALIFRRAVLKERERSAKTDRHMREGPAHSDCPCVAGKRTRRVARRSDGAVRCGE